MPAPGLWTWLTIPAIGAVIGWSTNWLAVKMIFRPVKPGVGTPSCGSDHPGGRGADVVIEAVGHADATELE